MFSLVVAVYRRIEEVGLDLQGTGYDKRNVVGSFAYIHGKKQPWLITHWPMVAQPMVIIDIHA